jgi:hypothetical protein
MARKPRAASAAPKDTTTPGVDQSAPVTTFENSPEFQAAVASAVAKAVPALIPALREQILQNLGTARGDAPAVPGDHLWADALAMSIAQITDQGTGRKTVAPAVLKARSEARALMVQLIVEARAARRDPALHAQAQGLPRRGAGRSDLGRLRSHPAADRDRMAGRAERGDAAGERGRGGHLQGLLRLDRHACRRTISSRSARTRSPPAGSSCTAARLCAPQRAPSRATGFPAKAGCALRISSAPARTRRCACSARSRRPARQQA